MISPTLQAAFNDQLNRELYSSYIYMAMSAYMEHKGLKGMAAHFATKAAEEKVHADKFYAFIHSRGGRVILQAIDAPPSEWESPLAAFKGAYDHECLITASINDLVSASRAENDHAAEVFLQWFVTEQVEEEETAQEAVDALTLIGDNGMGLFMYDRDLSSASAAPAASGEA